MGLIENDLKAHMSLHDARVQLTVVSSLVRGQVAREHT
jgi:hypothetical protein